MITNDSYQSFLGKKLILFKNIQQSIKFQRVLLSWFLNYIEMSIVMVVILKICKRIQIYDTQTVQPNSMWLIWNELLT